MGSDRRPRSRAVPSRRVTVAGVRAAARGARRESSGARHRAGSRRAGHREDAGLISHENTKPVPKLFRAFVVSWQTEGVASDSMDPNTRKQLVAQYKDGYRAV